MRRIFSKQDVIWAIETLELPKDGNFTNDDINRRYRELLNRVHPDKGGSTRFAKEANEARDILRDWLKGDKPGFENKEDEDDADRRQREAWERAQKAKQGQSEQQKKESDSDTKSESEAYSVANNKSQTKKTDRWRHSRNFQVAMRFWSDGVLRIGVLGAMTGAIYATVQTDFWEYSPVTNVKAEYAVICWPKHYYGENITFAEGEGVSYVNPEALPPDMRAFYEGKNAEIMAMLGDPRSELMKKAKWGGYPVVTVWNEAQKKPGEPLLEVKAVESEAAQTCSRYSQEAQRVALNNHQ